MLTQRGGTSGVTPRCAQLIGAIICIGLLQLDLSREGFRPADTHATKPLEGRRSWACVYTRNSRQDLCLFVMLQER